MTSTSVPEFPSDQYASGRQLGDEEIANVASYIRNSFGNKADPITAGEVSAYRSSIKK